MKINLTLSSQRLADTAVRHMNKGTQNPPFELN